MTRLGMTLPVTSGWVLIISIALLLMFVGPGSCGRAERKHPEGALGAPTPLRPVRVLIASNVERLRVRADGGVTVEDESRAELGSVPAGEWLLARPSPAGTIRIGRQSFSAEGVYLVAARAGSMQVSIARDGEWASPVEYPGDLHLACDSEGGLDVVNRVDVERYVACVVGSEIWPSFAEEAYRAQAIVVRTYALYQMGRRQSASFDLSATEGAQVYRGIRRDGPGRRAVKAAKDTRGLVCTWRDKGRDRLFSTYYSAVCGGVSQSAAIFGKADDVPPLAGGVRCDFCKIAPGDTYRWGPVRITGDEVLSNLAVRYAEFESWVRITAVKVIKRTPSGRPVRLRLIGESGQRRDILAERFRLAMGSMVVKSTDFEIRVEDGDIVFQHGRGFGHGLGLCQWGMQGQALAGRRAGEILRFYYPGSRLTRVY